MNIRSLEENISLTTTQPRLRTWLFGLFGISALALSAFGIYASTAFTVTQRTREIGVRLALGATPAQVLGLVLTRSARVTAIGVAAGLIGALGLAQLLRGVLPDVDPANPGVLAALAVFLPLVALLASAHPAFVAARLNPTRALQHE
jgi:putative ABC transport system permease protein